MNQTFKITGYEFSVPMLIEAIAPPSTPIVIRYGKGRRESSPHPTRRQRRLCAHYGHPTSRLAMQFRGDAVMREVTGGVNMDGESEYDISYEMHNISEGRFCERCGENV